MARRRVGFVPTVFSLIAFILGVLCLFAGSKKGMLTSGDIFTLYTPSVGDDDSVPDFYSIYVMNYCEGFLTDGIKKMTSCSGHDILFSFDPAKVLQEETGNTTSLANLGWPDAVTDDFYSFSTTSRSMGIFYCIGAAVAGLVVLIRLGMVASKKPQQSMVEAVSLLLGFVMLCIPSIITTVIAFQFVGLVNFHGKEQEVTAEYGVQFFGMTWAAAGMALVGGLASLTMVLVDRNRTRSPVPADEPKGSMDDGSTVRSFETKHSRSEAGPE